MSKCLFCLIGPSGCGKTSVADALEANGYRAVRSYTTRKPRYEGEGGHIFVSEEFFSKLDLISKTVFSGASYGVTEDLLNDSDVFVVDVAGFEYLKQHYRGHKKIVSIALVCPMQVCKSRMLERGDSEEAAGRRVKHDKAAFADYVRVCDYLVDATETKDTVVESVMKVMQYAESVA